MKRKKSQKPRLTKLAKLDPDLTPTPQTFKNAIIIPSRSEDWWYMNVSMFVSLSRGKGGLTPVAEGWKREI
jgi:hypothetical protein